MIDFVVDYMENVRERPVLPSVEPGYLQPLIPDRPPYLPESWNKIMPDIEKYIMPGVSIALFLAFHHHLRPTASTAFPVSTLYASFLYYIFTMLATLSMCR